MLITEDIIIAFGVGAAVASCLTTIICRCCC